MFESYEDGADTYELTGLSRGGQQMAKLKANYKRAIELLVELASLQASFITLDIVVKTTNRRVNAIEHGECWIQRQIFIKMPEFAKYFQNRVKFVPLLSNSKPDVCRFIGIGGNCTLFSFGIGKIWQVVFSFLLLILLS